ncbi:MAG TPA: ABC transporter ATP-binding protein, partial [Anaerolineaceae bacterium]|nr:ABC transporter ATP-binding protein [Anaerolineaceae bacterium]
MKIQLEGLTKKFGPTVAVDNFTVAFESGKLTALLGPSGCGKSTMLYMLAGITPATRGKIYFDNDDVTQMAPEKRGVGLVFQNYALYPHMTVMENICFPLEIQRVPRVERIARAVDMAKLVHVEELLERKPAQLSGGQQQRVAIARSLVKRPRLLLLDEPLSNLDARLRLEMREEIRRIQQETHITTIFVTHDQEEAMSISDAVLLMKLGVQQQFAGPQELYDNPANAFVAEFLGVPPINRLYGVIRDGAFVLEDGSAACRLPAWTNLPEGKRVILAIRAESVFLAEEPGQKVFDAEITQIYTMGKEELSYLRFGTCEIRGYLSGDGELQARQTIPVGLKAKGVFLFD